jgi:predicted esterase
MGTRYEGDTIALTLQRGKEEINLPAVVLGGPGAAQGPAFLGVLPLRDDTAAGVAIRFVYPKSPAEAAGLKAGDRILKVGRSPAPGQPAVLRPIANRDALLALFDTATPGIEVKLEVQRKDGGKTETLTAKLGEVPDAVPEKLPAEASARKAAGKKDKVETGLVRRKNEAGDRDYWVYVPENYDPAVAHAVVVWLHPPGKNRERDVDDLVFAWQGYCEDNHLILVGPAADNETGWTPGDSPLVQEALRWVGEAYTVDRRRVVAHGMGQGGQMAYYLGFYARSVVRGVATVGAALASNPKERVANQPLSFFLAVGGKDPLRAAVADTKAKLLEQKYPVVHREVPELGHEYLDGGAGVPVLDELVRWIDSLDRL